ncbi:MAG: hypothetical protein V7603_5767 [Micromonosporaceae bacterium]|jgi:hypothetical protein
MSQILSPGTQLDTAPSLEDRCDHCGAAAKLHVDLSGGGSLAFCGHHANQHTEEITRLAQRVVVEDGFHWRGRA